MPLVRWRHPTRAYKCRFSYLFIIFSICAAGSILSWSMASLIRPVSHFTATLQKWLKSIVTSPFYSLLFDQQHIGLVCFFVSTFKELCPESELNLLMLSIVFCFYSTIVGATWTLQLNCDSYIELEDIWLGSVFRYCQCHCQGNGLCGQQWYSMQLHAKQCGLIFRVHRLEKSHALAHSILRITRVAKACRRRSTRICQAGLLVGSDNNNW